MAAATVMPSRSGPRLTPRSAPAGYGQCASSALGDAVEVVSITVSVVQYGLGASMPLGQAVLITVVVVSALGRLRADAEP